MMEKLKSFTFMILFLALNFSCSGNQILVPDNVLSSYPSAGSFEEVQDIAALVSYQNNRNEKDCEIASQEVQGNFDTFFGSSNEYLTSTEIENVKKLFYWIYIKAGANILYFKEKFDRPRPYITHPEIKPCIELENTDSYPSGHATLSRVYARLLSVAFPERALLFMKRADEIALHRLLGGVHHPSDIEAGKKLGDAIADQYLNDLDFKNRLEEVGKLH